MSERSGGGARSISDLALVLAAITAAWILSRWVIYPALGIPDYAPLILRPILGFLAAWAVVRRCGEGFASLGLRTPVHGLWDMVAIYGVCAAPV